MYIENNKHRIRMCNLSLYIILILYCFIRIKTLKTKRQALNNACLYLLKINRNENNNHSPYNNFHLVNLPPSYAFLFYILLL